MLALRPTPATGSFDAIVPTGAFRPTGRVHVVLPGARQAASPSRPAVRAIADQAARVAAGRFLGATSTALAMRSGLGNGPWDTLTSATHHVTGMGVGAIGAAISASFVAAAWRLGARPNPVLLAAHALAGGAAVDWILPRVPDAAGDAPRAYAYLAGAVAASVLGSVVVLGAPVARTAYDHLLMRVVDRRGWGLRRARWALDLPALAAGWVMGGGVGPGTLVCALLVGPLAQRVGRAVAARPDA